MAHPGEPPRRCFPAAYQPWTPSAGFYDFSKKINKSMEEIHADVPRFNELLLKSVERTLSRFEPHQPFERSSWEIVDDYNLYHRERRLGRLVGGV